MKTKVLLILVAAVYVLLGIDYVFRNISAAGVVMCVWSFTALGIGTGMIVFLSLDSAPHLLFSEQGTWNKAVLIAAIEAIVLARLLYSLFPSGEIIGHGLSIILVIVIVMTVGCCFVTQRAFCLARVPVASDRRASAAKSS